MWKYLNESAQGTSHRLSGAVCQDASFVTPYTVEGDDVIILACSDGAGSAKEAQVGAALACSSLTVSATTFFESGRNVSELTEATALSWMQDLRKALAEEADRRAIVIRDLACTLIFAIVGAERAMFLQIGDGAIVVLQDEKYSQIFWPQSGEYQNTTFFVTDEEFQQRLQLQFVDRTFNELAMFTDGLQMLALNYANKTVHEPFFKPMFTALRATADSHDLIVPLKQFLDSTNVNNRTDDDKTLILVTRVPSGDAIL